MEPGNFWASWVVTIVAMYEIFAATIWSYASHPAMIANDGVTGGLIFMFAFWVLATDEAWASYVAVALGGWLVVSAAVFEHGVTAALVNDVVVGVVIMFFAYMAARHGRAVWARGFDVIERGTGFLR